jgi:hypothetical protein
LPLFQKFYHVPGFDFIHVISKVWSQHPSTLLTRVVRAAVYYRRFSNYDRKRKKTVLQKLWRQPRLSRSKAARFNTLFNLLLFTTRMRFVAVLMILVVSTGNSFILQPPVFVHRVARPMRTGTLSQVPTAFTKIFSDKFNRDIEERSRQRAAGQGGGSVAAGAVLGGLIGGPFGALFGAQIGANLGVKNALNKARKEEMERLGITQEMLDAAEEIGFALQQSMEGMEATKNSLQTHQSLARRIDSDVTELYNKATAAMERNDEDAARNFLLKRTQEQESLKKVLKLCAEEKKRLEIMESNVDALQRRAMEVEGMLQRTVGAKARQDSFTDFSISSEDPLLQKFKDMGID